MFPNQDNNSVFQPYIENTVCICPLITLVKLNYIYQLVFVRISLDQLFSLKTHNTGWQSFKLQGKSCFKNRIYCCSWKVTEKFSLIQWFWQVSGRWGIQDFRKAREMQKSFLKLHGGILQNIWTLLKISI